MPITFEDVTAEISPPPAAAPPSPAAAPTTSPDAVADEVRQALRLQAERLARLSAD